MAYSQNQALFSARTTDGNSNAVSWPGGRGVFAVFGTFGGATCKLQWSPDADAGGSTWLDVDAAGDAYVTRTANGAGGFELPPCQIRAVQSGSTTTSLTATVGGLRL
ncbi:hypothetical protein [Bradyrhizobium sp.]|jgi:hypothetical protein|uniref:hypothetical protein n=1 Tax=Bradyrhizobium sp. TaxID=376 RepID=UPI002DDCD419|nr:hypothetical protein [Bradyrhizobium sp.]HEV2155442.1 hypothetical protein [Bradyrhizobium sp.]